MKKVPHWSDHMPKSFNRLYALVFGYFWKTCPDCGEWFGGHEVDRPFPAGYRIDGFVEKEIRCPDCDADGFNTAAEMNFIFDADIFPLPPKDRL